MREIPIDERTQQVIKELIRVIGEAQARLQLVVQTVANMHDVSGTYRLSDDLTKLIVGGDEDGI